MKKAKWIIVNLGDSDDVQSLSYAIQETGRESKIISLKHAYENIIDMPDDNHEVVIHKGPIGVSIGFKKSHPNWIGNFHNKDTFRCLTYYSYWGKYITQSRYLFSTYAEIVRRKDWLYENFSVNEKLFIRPDSCEKEFNGELVSVDQFNTWAEHAGKCLEYNSEPPSFMCVVSSPVNIDREYRFIIADGKVITGSVYRANKHISYESLDEDIYKDRAVGFVEKVLGDNPPPLPPVYCLDLALDKEKFSILEVGCFCCCGLYKCDLKKIALAVSETVEKLDS